MKKIAYKFMTVLAKAIVYAAFSAVGLTAAQGCVAGGDIHFSMTAPATVEETTNTAE